MAPFDPIELDLLQRYPRAIVHMRRRLRKARKLGLVFGAGICKDLDLPDWDTLLKRIAKHKKVQAEEILPVGGKTEGPPAGLADVLYRDFSENRLKELTKHYSDEHLARNRVRREWLSIISECLYAEIGPIDQLEGKHPYLSHLLGIITSSAATVNYNFDSVIEMLLDRRSKASGAQVRPYQVVVDSALPLSADKSVIYHPNGYLPFNVLEAGSDSIVLSEKEFGDQLIDSVVGRHSFLSNHLCQFTLLFIGLSMRDETLRHLLRRNSTLNPGHYHYWVEWVSAHDPASSAEKRRRAAQLRSRFETYNLITLHLTNAEIAALGKLLSDEPANFLDKAAAAKISVKYVYYLVGIPGIGKTSSMRYLASLDSFDEWAEEPLGTLAKPFDELSSEEERKVDWWIARQFQIKNDKLVGEQEGMFLIDRAPLDPVSFTPEERWSEKAEFLLKHLQGGKDSVVQPGNVLLLLGKPEEVQSRLRPGKSDKPGTDYLTKLQAKLQAVYDGTGVHPFQTEGLDLPHVVKDLARTIFLGSYSELDLGGRLQDIRPPGSKAATV